MNAHRITAIPGKAKKLLVCTAIASAASSAAGVIIRRNMSAFLDADMPYRDLSFWIVVLAAAAVYALCAAILPRLQKETGVVVTDSIYERLQSAVSDLNVLARSPGGAGELSTLFTKDARSIERCMGRITARLIPDVLSWLAACFLLTLISPVLLLAAAVVSAIPLAAMFFWSKGIRAGNERYLKELERVNRLDDEAFRHLELIKARQTQPQHLEKQQAAHARLHRRKFFWNLRETLVSVPSLFFSFAMAIGLAATAGYLYTAGAIGLSDTALVVLLTDYIVNPVMAFDNTVVAIRRAQTARKRLDAFAVSAEADDGEPEPPRADERGIVLSDVTFAYPGAKPIISDCSRTLQPGRPWYLTGENGTGKSTLIFLLAGVYIPQRGSIRIDGTDTRMLRRQPEAAVSVCTQDMLLFPDSVMGNLTRGRDLPEEDVYRICRQIGIHEEICALPEGYATVLGENGAPLSRGQRQRICICRTLLDAGPVFIFDEPTAALDPAHGRLVMQCLEDLAKQRLVLIVTHERDGVVPGNVLRTEELR